MIGFHWYGFILGLALVIGWQVVELKARREKVAAEIVNQTFIWAVGGGLLGARLWHVLTDWHLYQHNWLAVGAIWNGGLSIIGAVIGGVVGVWWSNRTQPSRIAVLLDLSVFGLPFAQAIGRLGNYINQELYGYPSELPWAIRIDPSYRLAEFRSFDTFHPLFLYELIATLVAGVFLWLVSEKQGKKIPSPFKLGEGGLFLLYLEYYAGIRILLDGLRPSKTLLVGNLGVNQAILIVFLVVNGWYLWKQYEKRTLAQK